MKNAIVYACAPGSDPIRLHEQIYDCMKSAKARRLNLVGIFTDGNAASISSRGGIQQVMSYILTGRVDYLIVTDVSRLSRNLIDMHKIQVLMHSMGCQLIALDGTKDSDWWNELSTKNV